MLSSIQGWWYAHPTIRFFVLGLIISLRIDSSILLLRIFRSFLHSLNSPFFLKEGGIDSSILLLRIFRSFFHSFDLPPPFLKEREEVNFNYLPWEGRLWKIFKRGWKYGAGAGLLKRRGGWHFSHLFFSRFIIFTFRNYFILCKTVLCIQRKKKFFFLLP